MGVKSKRKPVGKRVYSWHFDANKGPAWRYVEFEVEYKPGFTKLLARFVYPSLEMANNARIIARAMYNWSVQYKNKPTWAAFARHIGCVHIPKDGRPRASLGDAVSAKLYGNVQRGTLPEDEAMRQRLFDLAGYPWD